MINLSISLTVPLMLSATLTNSDTIEVYSNSPKGYSISIACDDDEITDVVPRQTSVVKKSYDVSHCTVVGVNSIEEND